MSAGDTVRIELDEEAYELLTHLQKDYASKLVSQAVDAAGGGPCKITADDIRRIATEGESANRAAAIAAEHDRGPRADKRFSTVRMLLILGTSVLIGSGVALGAVLIPSVVHNDASGILITLAMLGTAALLIGAIGITVARYTGNQAGALASMRRDSASQALTSFPAGLNVGEAQGMNSSLSGETMPAGSRHEHTTSSRTQAVRRSLSFVAGQAQASGTASASAVTSAVTTSFAFGWQMARFYTGPLSSAAEPRLEQDLPGLSGLPAAQLVKLGLGQADVALSRLKAFLGDAQLPTTDAVRAATETDPPDRDAIRKAILDLHIALLIQLTAADYRLGKAYGLGRALADTCASAHGDATERRQALEHHLEPHRALVIAGWLDDLKTVLPAHASQGVADSLERWTQWAQTAGLTTLDPKAVNDTTHVLHRCGQRWRAILSGEKDAQDLLTTPDYVSAARGTLARVGAIARSLAWQLRGPLAAAAVLIGVGIWLIVANNSTAQVLAGLGTIAGGLGITWRSAAGALGHLSLDLVRPLWQAQIDLAVATRLTPLPQRDYVPGLERPRSRLARAWRELRTADPEAPRGMPAKPRSTA